MKKILDSVLEAIGNTPLVRLTKITSQEEIHAEILAKLEYLNPSGSTKDRIALQMIKEAEANGQISPGKTIIEATTGNTGIALSMVAAAKGYKFRAYTPDTVSNTERMKIMACYGAEQEVVKRDLRTADESGVHGALFEIAPRIRCRAEEQRNADVWWARQFNNPENVRAHKETTGKEIIDDTDGHVDVFVASVGTGGTLLGVAQALKERVSGVRIVAVEPESHPLLSQGEDAFQLIPGITDGILWQALHDHSIDEVVVVKDEEAIVMARRLAEEEGLFCGVSSGANVFASVQIAKKMKKESRVVTVLPDNRDRYLREERYIT